LNGAQYLKRGGRALRRILNWIALEEKITKFLLWKIIVIRKYLVEWMTTGVIQRTEAMQRIKYFEPVCLQNAETSHLLICTTNFDLFLVLEIKCVYLWRSGNPEHENGMQSLDLLQIPRESNSRTLHMP